MDRKKLIIGISVVVIIAASVFAYISGKNPEFASSNNETLQSSSSEAATNNQDTLENAAAVLQTETDRTIQNTAEPSITPEPPPVELMNSEDIEVGKNSAEFDLKAVLYEAADKATFLKLEYYMDGETKIKEFSETDIPETKAIFEKRDTNGPTEDGFRIGQLLLNSKYSKVYFTVIGEVSASFCATTVYSINLNDTSIKKFGSMYGRVGSILLNKNCKYVAYSYLNSPLDSNHCRKRNAGCY